MKRLIPYILLLLFIPQTTNAVSQLKNIQSVILSQPKAHTYITALMSGKQTVTPEYKLTFWSHYQSLFPLTPQKKEVIRDYLIGNGILLLSYLYKDMMISIYIEKPFKSEERDHYEKRLVAIGAIGPETIHEHDLMLKKILHQATEERKKSSTKEKLPLKTLEETEKIMKVINKSKRQVMPLFS